jgi:hypothetical protein
MSDALWDLYGGLQDDEPKVAAIAPISKKHDLSSSSFGTALFGPKGSEIPKHLRIDYHTGEPVEMKDANITSLLQDPTIPFLYVKGNDTFKGLVDDGDTAAMSSLLFGWLLENSGVEICRACTNGGDLNYDEFKSKQNEQLKNGFHVDSTNDPAWSGLTVWVAEEDITSRFDQFN